MRTAEETHLRKDRTQSGFTLIELMIVMAIIGILITLAIPSFVGAIRHAREAALKEDLQTMRTAIDTYTMDKQKAPQSLDDLIQDGYLRAHSRGSHDPQQRYLGHRKQRFHGLAG